MRECANAPVFALRDYAVASELFFAAKIPDKNMSDRKIGIGVLFADQKRRIPGTLLK